MNMYSLITKTKRAQELTSEEIKWLVDGYVKGEIPDYQVSAWLMAVCLNSLSDRETVDLTLAMRDSGGKIDLSTVKGITVDKHSTGGVGDKTSLIIGPVAAACGVSIAKMSGKGLGHTGGTIDKLESIPGCRTVHEFSDFIDFVNNTGFSIVSQSGDLVPADKKLYALRDATATVDSIPLIASSIMSKKLAMGADCILLDVKTGSGAFMKTVEEAKKLADLMVSIGKSAGKKCMAVITDMDIPLGCAVGNAPEVREAAEILRGVRKGRLYDLCMELSAYMLMLAGKGDPVSCRKMAEEAVSSGRALDIFVRSVAQQGGDTSFVNDLSLMGTASKKYEIRSTIQGYICGMDSEKTGLAALELGAGRRTKESSIDYTAGIVLAAGYGDYVNKGDLLMTLYTSSVRDFDSAEKLIRDAVVFSDTVPPVREIILGVSE